MNLMVGVSDRRPCGVHKNMERRFSKCDVYPGRLDFWGQTRPGIHGCMPNSGLQTLSRSEIVCGLCPYLTDREGYGERHGPEDGLRYVR